MDQQCSKVELEDEFFVETWSGDEDPINPICSLRGHSNVKHNVRVGSIRLYTAKRVKCEGFIRSDSPVIIFSSSDPKYWSAYVKGLSGGETFTFSKRALEAVGEATGTEKIYAMVTVDWYPHAKSQTISLDIEVQTG